MLSKEFYEHLHRWENKALEKYGKKTVADVGWKYIPDEYDDDLEWMRSYLNDDDDEEEEDNDDRTLFWVHCVMETMIENESFSKKESAKLAGVPEDMMETVLSNSRLRNFAQKYCDYQDYYVIWRTFGEYLNAKRFYKTREEAYNYGLTVKSVKLDRAKVTPFKDWIGEAFKKRGIDLFEKKKLRGTQTGQFHVEEGL